MNGSVLGASQKEVGQGKGQMVDGGPACSEDAEEEDPQGRRPKVPVDPRKLTRKEIEEHNALHWPFRSWCPHCVRAKAVSSPHPRRRGEIEMDKLEETEHTGEIAKLEENAARKAMMLEL